MSGRGRRQRLELDQNPNNADANRSLQGASIVDEEFRRLLEDVESIRAGPAPKIDDRVIEEVRSAPGWVRVSCKNTTREAVSASRPQHYFWNPSTGQVSWVSPEGQNASSSLDITRSIVSHAVARLRQPVEAQLAGIAPSVERAIQASTLANLLDSLAKEQQRSPLEQTGTMVSRVWCSVHACIAAAVAALSGAAPAVGAERAPKPENELLPPQPAPAAVSDDDMEVSEDGELEKPQYMATTHNALPASTIAAGPLVTEAEQQAQQGQQASKKRKSAAPSSGDDEAAVAGTGKTATASRKPEKLKGKGMKGAASLINKWTAVQKELQEEDEKLGEEPPEDDTDAWAALQEQKRLREGEEWRIQQLRSGAVSSVENANFAPLMGDWRDRLKAKQQGDTKNNDSVQGNTEEKFEAVAEEGGDAAPAVMTSHSMPNLDELSVGLPEGWRAMWDATSGGVYYGNLVTQATQWERPV